MARRQHLRTSATATIIIKNIQVSSFVAWSLFESRILTHLNSRLSPHWNSHCSVLIKLPLNLNLQSQKQLPRQSRLMFCSSWKWKRKTWWSLLALFTYFWWWFSCMWARKAQLRLLAMELIRNFISVYGFAAKTRLFVMKKLFDRQSKTRNFLKSSTRKAFRFCTASQRVCR